MNPTREEWNMSQFKWLTSVALVVFALAGAAATDARAQGAEKLTIVIFAPPSLGAMLPPVIKAQKFDEKNGLDITFQERTPDAYAAQFNSGEFKVGGSASLTTLGLADVRGVKVKYLFNIFDFWGTIVTSRDSVKTLKDLEGKELAGARSTTNYQMFDFFAKRQGVDMSKVKVVNTAPPGLVSYAVADRADAVQIWEPAYTLMLAKKPSIRTIDIGIQKAWREFGGGSFIPYLGVGAHTEWADANPRTVAKLYATYKAAAEWVQKNPDEAAPLLAKGASPDELKAIAAMIRSNERLAMKFVAAGTIKKEIEAVYKAGVEINYLPKMPSGESIYDKPLQ
jgi:ABC-type nitrate/sulfonate/bicarbonate transport system substrate-binding protein